MITETMQDEFRHLIGHLTEQGEQFTVLTNHGDESSRFPPETAPPDRAYLIAAWPVLRSPHGRGEEGRAHHDRARP